MLRWFEFLLIHLVDDHWNFLDVFLSSDISQRLARHSVVAYIGDVRINGSKHASMGSALDGLLRLPSHDARLLSRRL